MARRRRNDNLDHLIDLLIALPWWVSVIFAGAMYVFLAAILPGLLASNPLLAGIALGLRQVAGLIAGLFLLLAPISFLRSFQRRRLLDRQSGLDSIRALSWQEFEKLCGEVYRSQGFAVTENGLGGADGGVDLILKRSGETWLVQCKRWKTFKVGVKEIRELYGIVAGERADRGVFITCGVYTPEARAFAEGKPLDLVDGPALLELVREVQRVPAPAASHGAESPAPAFTSSRSLSSPPSCPRCGATMVRRTAKRGANAGGQFWGCSTYPKCHAIVDVR